jgi:bifunctional UDP-N-acetylglucosamine pyrophosphorylase/glucosamine-1-phosphate N-acetyltransferase
MAARQPLELLGPGSSPGGGADQRIAGAVILIGENKPEGSFSMTETTGAGRLAVVILAAGKGTRMNSALPKVLHPIGGRSLIAHVLDTALGLSPETVIAVVRHDRERVAEAIVDHAPDTVIVDQDEIPGTGRAVEQALAALPAGFDGTVVVLSGDVPLLDSATLSHLVRGHLEKNRAMTLLSAIFENPTGLGRILRGENGQMFGIIEEKDASETQRGITEVNGGVYVFGRAALESALSLIDTNNTQGEKYLTDAASRILAGGGIVDAVATKDTWLIAGVNDRAQLADAGKELNRRIVRRHQLAGVTVQDPATTWIDATVSIGVDSVILPGTFLRGATTIDGNAEIGPDTTLVDCEVGEGAHVRRTEATLAVIGAGADVGPFAYLRAGTELGMGGKIGAYVETKNAKIGTGSKVPHLSYVGDATIGTGSNIGAGTIFANYDGIQKHHTVVGDQVRIGSKNVLIAPVTIADGVYTAAGTIVRKDVPAGALGVTVAPQRNIIGWVAENRPGTITAQAAQKSEEHGA